MCLILFGYKASKKYPLIFAANRDEFYARPTKEMHFWQEYPDILAGKDLEAGGTWFGCHKSGSFAGLTNYRNPALISSSAPSRGEIIVDFLLSGLSPPEFVSTLKNSYNGFNLIFGSVETLFWFSNIKNRIEKIKPGIHCISNKFLDSPWPKVILAKKLLKQIIGRPFTTQELFRILKNDSCPPDGHLPRTGVSPEFEKILAPVFVSSPHYGTCSSIIMLADTQNRITITERSYSRSDPGTFTDQTFSLG